MIAKIKFSSFIQLVLVACVFICLPELLQAQTNAPAAQPTGPLAVIQKIMPLVAMLMVIFHFMVLKPQQDKLKKQQALLEGLKKGDQVSTTGGLIGRVAGVEKDHILLEIASNVKVKFERSHILEYTVPVEKTDKP